MNELKACPFCGGKVDMKSVVIYSNGERSPASIKCKKCNYCMTAFDNDELIKRWNTRPIEDAAIARAEAAEARAERYEDALQQIDNWAKAYPLDVFPEPDFKRVREALEAAGITLDSVSASNMRHVITGVARIVEKALKGGEE